MFMIQTGLIAFGFWILVWGFKYHIWQLEAYGIAVLIVSLFAVSLQIADRTEE